MLAVCGLLASLSAASATLSIQAGSIRGPSVRIEKVDVRLDTNGSATVSAERILTGNRTVSRLKLDCTRWTSPAGARCEQGRLEADGLVDSPWQVDAKWAARHAALDVITRRGARLNATDVSLDGSSGVLLFQEWPVVSALPWWPADVPAPSAGVLSGNVSWKQAGAMLDGKAAIIGLAFASADGTRAAEGVTLQAEGHLRRDNDAWQAQATLQWPKGEVYWQPLYLKAEGAPFVQVEGRWRDRDGELPAWHLVWPGIGRVDGSLAWRKGQLAALAAKSDKLQLGPLYLRALQPLLAGSVLEDLDIQGAASASIDWRDGRLTALDLDIADLFAEDRKGRVAIYGLSGNLPWRPDEMTNARFQWQGGQVFHLPFDAANLSARVQGSKVQVAKWIQPAMGGRLVLEDFSAERRPDGWYGGLKANLEHLSMPQLSSALGWPRIDGELDGELPRLALSPEELRVFGPIEVQAFDGIAFLRNLRLKQPFSPAPVLTTDAALQHIDLGKLTRTFSFGSIDGQVDASIDGLTLISGKPVAFDARIRSTPGDYPKRISQRAVQNISSLGGGGAAALSTTFLRVFQSFGYRELGMSCRLQDGVCEMGGIANVPQGYYMVIGAGVPSINVIGYNRRVNWSELVDRLKRVTQGGGPVVHTP